MKQEEKLLRLLEEHHSLGIAEQIDYQKFYLYSLITHSTAIEGSTVTEIENQLLFDEGITAKGRTLQEQMMNLDLKAAYEQSMQLARLHADFSVEMLKSLSALVMKNTGAMYNTAQGSFDASKGDLRLVGVTAGTGGRSYMNYQKVPGKLAEFCEQLNRNRHQLMESEDMIAKYQLSFDAHYQLVTIHPWVDGNGRMSRLVMNQLQYEFGLVPVKIIKENKAEYIQALIDSREQESLAPFRAFMMEEHIRNISKEIEEYKKTQEGDLIKGSDEQIPLRSVELSERQRRIVGMIHNEQINERINEQINSSTLSAMLGISEITARRELNALREMGIIKRVGSKKTGHWEVIEGKG
ncbi:MAG: Fic family protein [Bacteroidales bacterium]|nr:Fic family protein [Bacteroidales bacterium]